MSGESPAVVRCAAHPDVETGLRCGRCDTPICPRCLVMTPVGARCRDCAQLRAHPLYDVRPLHYLKATAAGLAVAVVGGLVVANIPFFAMLGLMFLGYATGEAVSYAANRKRGRGLAAIAAAATVLGPLIAIVILVVGGLPPILPLETRLSLGVQRALGELLSLWGLFLGLAAVIAVSRLR
jgi:hypothetical protein